MYKGTTHTNFKEDRVINDSKIGRPPPELEMINLCLLKNIHRKIRNIG